MTNVIVLGIVGAFIILLGAAYRQSKKTRKELIAEMKEEILSNEPAPVEAPAPVEVKEVKAEVKEMVAAQEAPAPKPRNNRRRGRPGKKQETNSTK